MRTNRTGEPDSGTAVSCPVPVPLATAVLHDVPSELADEVAAGKVAEVGARVEDDLAPGFGTAEVDLKVLTRSLTGSGPVPRARVVVDGVCPGNTGPSAQMGWPSPSSRRDRAPSYPGHRLDFPAR
jgi:hypothetical protein